MTIDIPRWGFIEFLPSEASIRDFFIKAAPGSEARSQYIAISARDDGSIEVLIEEPRVPER